jgi:glycosyltransferase involved in cell wall biosynthesis
MLSEVTRRMGDYDALVEIWNGVPWLSPIWCRKPKLLILHHVHGPMWNQMFPRPIAAIGRALETRIAPPFYRRMPTVTTSDDSRQELLHLGWKPEMVSTGPVGVDEFFTPGESKTPHPSIVAVGRQAPVKRFIELLEQVKVVRCRIPEATLTLIGDGPDRGLIEQWIEREDAHDWVTLTGRISREELRSYYRRSWLMTSASLAEGWGLVLTEAAGCGTPAVATDIGGHRCSVIHGETGLLTSINELGQVMTEVLENHELRERLGRQAESRSRTLTWDALAAGVLEPLYRQTVQRH